MESTTRNLTSNPNQTMQLIPALVEAFQWGFTTRILTRNSNRKKWLFRALVAAFEEDSWPGFRREIQIEKSNFFGLCSKLFEEDSRREFRLEILIKFFLLFYEPFQIFFWAGPWFYRFLFRLGLFSKFLFWVGVDFWSPTSRRFQTLHFSQNNFYFSLKYDFYERCGRFLNRAFHLGLRLMSRQPAMAGHSLSNVKKNLE